MSLERLQALQAFNARLMCMSVDESSYAEIVHGIRKVIGCDFCALFLYDRKAEALVLRAADGYPDVDTGRVIPLDDPTSIHAQAFAEEYMVHLDDTSAIPGVNLLCGSLGSVLVLPILSNNGPVGVFDFGSRLSGAFGAGNISMCGMIVDQMSYGLENVRLVRELRDSRDAVIRGMALLSEIRDAHIGGHLSRICALSRYLAEQLLDRSGYHEVTPRFVEIIERAAALHDVGKVGIPDSILLKPGKLTDEEFAEMHRHTTIGAELLLGLIDDFGEYAMINMGADVAKAHHEWWNGQGYPHGLQGEEIPLSARIVAICDVYDALTSTRVYKDAWSHEDTVRVIREGAGTQFDPDLVAVFLAKPQDLLRIREMFPDRESHPLARHS
ncbi:hypothetical protein CSB20_14575 [bacterium DOLZORAL124_64_63]|nr:MAG: hypothetical protein CSB20_14575 [bacterium DOLZORAL124_64_63]